jgi:hypothetical protein
MLKNKIIGLILCICFICNLFTISISSDDISKDDISSFKTVLITSDKDYINAGYDFSKIQHPVFYEEQVLCEGHLPLVLDVSCMKEFSLKDNSKNSFIGSYEVDKKNIDDISYRYRVLVREDFVVVVPVFKEVEHTVFNEKNNSWNNYTESIFDKYDNITDYRFVWKEVKDLKSIDFKTSNKFIVDIVGSFKASLKSKSVDVVPVVNIGGFSKVMPEYAWWNSNWDHKKSITFNHSQIPSTLTNFPVLVNLSSDADLASYAQDDGDDICFTNSLEQ